MASSNAINSCAFVILTIIPNLSWTAGIPLEGKTKQLNPRQMNFVQNPDGSITATIAASQAFEIPGQGSSSFGLSETINFGPKGVSIDEGQSFTSDFGGNHQAFGHTNSQNSRQGPHGFESTGSNAVTNSFQNPFFQSSNAQANAFANQFNQGPIGGFNQFNNPLASNFGQGRF